MNCLSVPTRQSSETDLKCWSSVQTGGVLCLEAALCRLSPPDSLVKTRETPAFCLVRSNGSGLGMDNQNSHFVLLEVAKKKSKLSFLKRQGPLRVKLHNSLFIFKVSGFLVAVAEKDKLIPHVASRQNPLCVPGEAHAAGVWVSGQSAQGKHGLEGAGADIG